MEQEIVELLNVYGEILAEIEAVKAAREKAYDEAIPPEVRKRLDEIDEEFAGRVGVAQTNLDNLAKEIKRLTVQVGHTVKGATHMAVFVKAAEKVDMTAFKGFALSHPEALELVEVGLPSVQIRTAK